MSHAAGLPAGRLRAEKRTGSFTALMSALTSVVSGGQDAVAGAAVADLPYHKLDPTVDVEHLDICHLGHHKYALNSGGTPMCQPHLDVLM